MTRAKRRWRGHAFGLALDGPFELLGCAESHPVALPKVGLELSDRAALRRLMPAGSRPIAWRRDAGGAEVPDVIGHFRAGYLLDHPGFGVFHVSRSGRHVRCATAGVATWRWQRYLTGRVLPFATTLRGREPWHASAVALASGAVALVGDSGRGKTSLAVHLVLQGGRLLADDVVALEPCQPGVLAHPGPGLISLREPTVAQLSAAELKALGRRVGANEHEVRIAVDRQEAPLRLSVVYVLEPVPASGPTRLTPISPADPRLLLAATFNFALNDPARLVRQLDACATVARTARIVRAEVPVGVNFRKFAEEVRVDAERE
jgi:hypothetical protein